MKRVRWIAGVLAGTLGFAAGGCGGRPTPVAPLTPARAPARKGMSTTQKVLLVAGAAAVYYLYQKHKNKKGAGAQGQYFRSKNGRVYYRDLKTGAYHWVDPPQQPIQVPAAEYEQYFGQQPATSGGVIRQAPAQWNNPAYR